MGGQLEGSALSVDRVGGSVWQGYAITRVRTPILNGPLLVEWDISMLSLLIGKAAAGVRLQGAEYELTGDVFWGLTGKGIDGVNGQIQAQLLNPSLRQQGVSIDGSILVEGLGFSLSEKRVESAEGVIKWRGGQVKPRGRDTIDYPEVKGMLSSPDGNLLLSVSETKGNKPLGEAGLYPEKGIGSLKVFQRAITLAGEPGSGNDDKLLVNMQQPLSF